MFTNIDDFVLGGASLEHDASGKLSSRELKICTAALLLDVAYADKVLQDNEVETIFRLLDQQFALREAEAGDIAEVARYLVKDRSRLGSVIKEVNEKFTVEQKQTIVQLLFSVMDADQFAVPDEAKRITELSKRLGLTPEQVQHARKASELG